MAGRLLTGSHRIPDGIIRPANEAGPPWAPTLDCGGIGDGRVDGAARVGDFRQFRPELREPATDQTPSMRLTKLKLAGFKSFVDPTSVTLPGQLVGVVGPNGCGKSNIMDAVRWVLGESKASELRGESMQDVIFNGTTGRKPVSRASVELIFDNSLGRALGQWSQYAELAVKRVLTRNGQSDYFINNLKVRRKDITDLFLGTGLGPRAYAIIGQGMISRIIEAKPDDLRVFLEEAAGVTRYKICGAGNRGAPRRHPENLARVEDIRLELAAQMEKLEAQAEVARRYPASTTSWRGSRCCGCCAQAGCRGRAPTRRAGGGTGDHRTGGQMAALRETEARAEANAKPISPPERRCTPPRATCMPPMPRWPGWRRKSAIAGIPSRMLETPGPAGRRSSPTGEELRPPRAERLRWEEFRKPACGSPRPTSACASR